jgi:alpha-ketoglutarate-dependent taurine dioxygenase
VTAGGPERSAHNVNVDSTTSLWKCIDVRQGQVAKGATSLRIEPLDSTLGAEVRGLDVRDLSEPDWRTLNAAFNDHAVLVFPEQHLAPDEQRRFAEHFGPISTPAMGGSSRPLPRSGLDHGAFNVANLSETGDLLDDAGHEWNRTLAGNFEWHTDSSYMPVSAQASMLTAHVVPSASGETEWADMRAAWDSLPRTLRLRVEGRRAFHSFHYAQSRLQDGDGPGADAGAGAASGEDFRVGAPLRPLVKQHPVTGRSALYIGRHAFGVKGLSDRESEELLWELHELACRPPRIYRHEWQVGDLVVWDNRSVLHRGRPWDFAELRHLVHSRVAGDPLAEGAIVPYGDDTPSSNDVERNPGNT